MLPIVNNRPAGENSTNLVTLNPTSMYISGRKKKKEVCFSGLLVRGLFYVKA
jgi:hypothetical protein